MYETQKDLSGNNNLSNDRVVLGGEVMVRIVLPGEGNLPLVVAFGCGEEHLVLKNRIENHKSDLKINGDSKMF